MERKYIYHLIATLFLFIFIMSCSPKAQAPSQKPEAAPRVEAGQDVPGKASEWENLVSLAKKERRISLYSVVGGDFRETLIKEVRGKFGLELDMVIGRAAELTPKLLNERKAGIFAVDVYIGGAGSLLNDIKSVGVLDPLEPQLLLPEVLDPKAWWGSGLTYVDKDKQILAMVANPSPPLTINTSLVSREEVKSYLDLLNPKFKGKMILNDPATPGVSQFWFGVAYSRIMNLDYMKKLAQTDLTVTRDQRLQVDWLSQGKFLIAIAADPVIVTQFQKDAVPLELLTPKEGTHITSSSGNIALVNRAPHPYGAKMFINWMLTREAQTIFSKVTGFQSGRLDVPTNHLPPNGVRNPEVKYFSSIDEEFLKTLPEHTKMAREIFGPLMR